MKHFIFLGPTSFGCPQHALFGWEQLPPIARGALPRLLDDLREPAVIAIADGRFGDVSAVSHKEILQAINEGHKVWGLCSMGAIRAAELVPWGMQGFGSVYERFASDDTFADDEVALLHAPGAPYFAVSEPLVHIRSYCAELLASGVIGQTHHDRVIEHLKSLWFGDRSRELLSVLLAESAPITFEQVSQGLHAHQMKRDDLQAFLAIHSSETNEPAT